MWELLSSRSQSRLGPTLAEFRRAEARRLADELRSLARGGYSRVLSEEIVGPWAVAALAGRGSRASRPAFAAALRREGSEWRLELGAPVTIRPLRPDPGERLALRTQVAAELRADSPILEAGLWLDGRAVPARSGGLSPNNLTIFAETPELAAGPHTIVVLAIAGEQAAARAWTFAAQGVTSA